MKFRLIVLNSLVNMILDLHWSTELATRFGWESVRLIPRAVSQITRDQSRLPHKTSLGNIQLGIFYNINYNNQLMFGTHAMTIVVASFKHC